MVGMTFAGSFCYFASKDGPKVPYISLKKGLTVGKGEVY
jgi:hypothetical protein